MIPKVIHYCWFGGNPFSESVIRCKESWEKFFPDYEIKEWNEDNFPISCCAYIQEAYKAKKWAFVSDYARFWILYHEGGVYFDTDVEIIKSMDDIVARGPFMGCETVLAKRSLSVSRKDKSELELGVNPGLGIAANAGSEIYKQILNSYNEAHFLNPDGTENQQTVVTRTTNTLKEYGFKCNGKGIQHVADIYIYPSDYFCPICYATGEMTITDNTCAIHHYSASWKTEEEHRLIRIDQWARKYFGINGGRILARFIKVPFRLVMKYFVCNKRS